MPGGKGGRCRLRMRPPRARGPRRGRPCPPPARSRAAPAPKKKNAVAVVAVVICRSLLIVSPVPWSARCQGGSKGAEGFRGFQGLQGLQGFHPQTDNISTRGGKESEREERKEPGTRDQRAWLAHHIIREAYLVPGITTSTTIIYLFIVSTDRKSSESLQLLAIEAPPEPNTGYLPRVYCRSARAVAVPFRGVRICVGYRTETFCIYKCRTFIRTH